MTRTDGFAVMDISSDVVNDPKFRKLQRSSPEHVAVAFTAYIATVGESWKAGRRVSIEDAWPAILPFDAGACEALRAAGLLDRNGYPTARSWNGWFTPARKRRDATRDRWRRANDKRLAESTNDSADAPLMPRGSHADTGAIPSVPSVPSVPGEPREPSQVHARRPLSAVGSPGETQ